MRTSSIQASSRARVVIVGGGFGGLAVAKRLAAAPVDITLIDRQNHHCFQPLLYQVATAALSPADIAWPIRSIFSRQLNLRVVMSEVTGVDRDRREVVTALGHRYSFDHLVLASGATHHYFGHDEWSEVAPGLKRVEDATEIRRRILLAFERAELEDDPAERNRLLTFVLIGGGPTGVEMAGAIAEIAHFALSRDFRRIDPRAARILLLEAGPRILPTFPDDLAAYATRSLRRLGVEVRASTRVTACLPRTVATEREAIPCATAIWAAGVKASAAATWVGAERDRAGRIRVSPDLSLADDPRVFAIGDTAALTDARGVIVPGNAPAAKQMGAYVARVIAARLAGHTVPPPFAYRNYGDLATIGRKAAIFANGRMHLRGFLAWLLWCVAHIYYLIGARNRIIVALDWLWDYLTFSRGARLINGSSMRLDGVPAPDSIAVTARERSVGDGLAEPIGSRELRPTPSDTAGPLSAQTITD